MTRILVTGCNGYIGQHLVPALEHHGYAVRGLDRRPGDPSPTDFCLGDLNEATITRQAAEGVDIVAHLAAAKDDWGITANEYQRDNVDATRVLVEVGRRIGIRKWVFFSTVSVYGPSEDPVDEASPYRPINAYGRSKISAEKLFRDMAAEDEEQAVLIVRPSVVFGPRHPWNTNVSRLIEAIDRRRFLMVGRGRAIKSTSYIDNLVAATTFLVRRLEPGVHGYIYTDEPLLTTTELVAEISHRLGKRPPKARVPLRLALPLGAMAGVASRLTGRNLPITAERLRKFNTGTAFSARKLRSLGFEQPVPLPTALDRTIAWQMAHRS